MKSLAEIYQRHGGADCHSGSDKGTVHSYIPTYERLLAPYRFPGVRVLEIGLMTGHSLLAWEEFFDHGNNCSVVWGIDSSDQPLNGMADLRPLIAQKGHKILICDATDPVVVQQHLGDIKFDVIIEDASHGLEQQRAIHSVFWPRLAVGGTYIIEDIEDIDRSRQAFDTFVPGYSPEVVDLRKVKGRFDDVLVVFRR